MFRRLLLLLILSTAISATISSKPVLNKSIADEQNVKEDTLVSPLSFTLGMDIVNRYIWRGVEFGVDQNGGSTPHLQPTAGMTYSFSNSASVSLGIWGSYGFSGNYSESDIYLNLYYPTEAVDFSLTFNDYYYPYLNIPFTNFKSDGNGANTIDAQLLVTLKSFLPLSFLVSNNILNDVPDNKSLYVECGYAFEISNTNVGLFAGAAQGHSVWHGVNTDKFEFVNVGFKLGRSIKISDDFSIPVGIQWIYNHHFKKNYIVFKVAI